MYQRIFKRVLDFGFALFALALLLPLILILTVLVVVTQGWPAFFFQERAGLNGRKFRIYKFRSMNNAKGPDGSLLPDAQRTGRFGRFIRSTSLDELPGLINVLKGEMSVVGPRALLIRYLPYYTAEESIRHDVRPGIVGLAQIRGRNDQTWESTFSHDVYYARHCSLSWDIRIFFETFAVVLRREGIDSARAPLDEYRIAQSAGREAGQS